MRVSAEALPCPNRAAIVAEVEHTLAALGDPDRGARLSIHPLLTGQLLVLMTCSGEVFERTLSFSPSDCSDLTQTLTLLVESWLKRDWRAVARTTIPPPAQLSTADVRAAPAPVATTPAAAAILQPEATTLRASPSTMARSRAPSGRPDLVTSSQAPARRIEYLLLAAFGATSAPTRDDPIAWAAALGAERSLDEDWGVAVHLGGEQDSSRPVGIRGTFHVRTWSVDFLARLRFIGSATHTVELLLGPSVDLIESWTRDAGAAYSRVDPDLGIAAAARWRFRITSNLELSAALRLSVRSQYEEFRFGTTGSTLTYSPLRVGLLGGAIWSFD